MNQKKPSLVTAALIGGAFLGVTSAIPIVNFLNCICCLLIVGGGVLAAYFYLKSLPPGLPPPTYGDGALVGFLAGIIGAFIQTAVEIPIELMKLTIGFGAGEIPEQLEEVLNDPQVPEVLRGIATELLAGGLSAAIILLKLAITLVLGAIFATIGGIIGIALFNKPTVAPPPPVMPSSDQF